MPAVDATGLVKTYPGDVRALDGLDLTVPAGTVSPSPSSARTPPG